MSSHQCLNEQSAAILQTELTEENLIEIKGGRHPVIEQTIESPFIPNDLEMDQKEENADNYHLHYGWKINIYETNCIDCAFSANRKFCPCNSSADWDSRSNIYKDRSSDDIASGRSTFMVEMTETANILHNASNRSLVLMDEIGRGTSTYDGLSIAWACAQYLVTEVRALTMFATHYFELTKLPEQSDASINVHLKCKRT